MVHIIDNLPNDVLGFQLTKIITGEDYENIIIPAVEAAFSERKNLRLLYFLDQEFEKFEGAALWDDTKVGLKHYTHWEKIAIVTDSKLLKESLMIAGFFTPGEFQFFSISELAEAKEWLKSELEEQHLRPRL
ncbi:SpoIIAA family protein [Sediminitomix flava]|uniref:SpoIIAA-like protein n=1 Tax=Sediminitomix flava TaxID=379075 RepID=A0A315Z9B2_SEDFL|nr:STAS/SEC14 domain-containing protein [Sediminitomix flava]PWJ42101.1 SpoIIAA-like protein [Sediminitomix flava]